jgi:hypothetical protein
MQVMSSKMKVSEAKEIAGGLSKPSKMPGPAYSLPAKDCKVGSKLAQIPGTTCHNCYALKGNYNFSNVKIAMQKRIDSLNHPQWVEALVTQIASSKTDYFRWHDSGDIQSLEHLRKIVEVCKQLPNVNFWLPTREYSIVEQYRKMEVIPSNLTIRLSAHKIDSLPPIGYGLPTSTVHTKDAIIYGEECKAYERDNECGPCRSCWDSNVANVSYKRH